MSGAAPKTLSVEALLSEAARFTAQAQGHPMRAAQLAEQAGLPDLARALLARTGGLFDSAEAQRLLAAQPGRVLRSAAPRNGEQEMFVRRLAAALLSDSETQAPGLPPAQMPTEQTAPEGLPAGLSMIEAGQGPSRFALACERALRSAHGAGFSHVTLACASWGAQQDALSTLRARYGALVGGEEQPISVLSLEDVVKMLSAAWSWDLPRLARLMSGPVILDGLYSLAPKSLDVILPLLRDAAQVYGVPISGLHGQDYPWPDLFDTSEPRAAGPVGGAAQVTRVARPLTLPSLAEQLRESTGDTLVVLSSRASAARLTALLPGSVLLSSSLCPLHLADQVQQLALRRAQGETLRVVATVLPPQTLGPFEQVWHMPAPLPHLAEAQELCRNQLQIVNLTDVAPQVAWASEWQLTASLLDAGKTPDQPGTQREYHLRLGGQKSHSPLAGVLNQHRAELNYASLAAALVVRPGMSVPVFINYDAQAGPLLERIRHSGVFLQSALRYAAWLTPSEAERAVQRRQAHSLGWALLWEAAYDPQYGLAAEAVAAGQPSE